MPECVQPTWQSLDEDAALRVILEGTATETGERFFTALVASLVGALGTDGAMVTQYLPEGRILRALSFFMDGRFLDGYEFPIAGTPCETVIDRKSLVHFPDRLLDLFSEDESVTQAGLVSYLGMPLLDVDGTILGHVAVVDRRVLPEDPRVIAIFRIFAERAAAELRRMRAEQQVREREEKLARLVASAMDAVIELEQHGRISMVNAAAERIFAGASDNLAGRAFTDFLSKESGKRLERLLAELDGRPEGQRCIWIPGGLEARRRDGRPFAAEATLSSYRIDRHVFYTLILRNVEDRIEAEARIRSLTVQTEYLRQELEAAQHFGEIIGQSEALQQMLADVRQVAGTGATVLILGETGTGKELVARVIHDASRRTTQPFIKVNCAAIPADLIESEFFGHEKGSFTGATARREGRFALADGGTILLDEVGELPLALQGKLLRALQEGEFEPVGSSKTRKVDVRVLAATNRNLSQAVRDGRFREDLFFRLNVFPLHVPPLRDRGDDVLLLADAFIRRSAERIGRLVAPLSDGDRQRLRAYSWPGNIRELQNVVERAVITAQDGRLNLARALPEPDGKSDRSTFNGTPNLSARIYTVEDLQELERTNIRRALETCRGKVAGPDGAAQLLGMKPSTLSSRMKALGIRRSPSDEPGMAG